MLQNNFTKTDPRTYHIESFCVDVIEDILIIMEDNGITKQDLANYLEIPELTIKLILDGNKNMPLQILADICFFLNIIPKITFTKN